jgi:hypothetical protein
VRVKSRTARGSILLVGKKLLQLGVFLRPLGFALIKSVCKPAPTNVLGKDNLLRLGRISALGFKLLYKADSLDISLISRLFSVRKVKRVADNEVSASRLLGGPLRDNLRDLLVKLFSLGCQSIISS